MTDDCYCCGSDDPCNQVNCTFFEGEFASIPVTAFTSWGNGVTPPTTFTSSAAQSISKGNPPPCVQIETTLEASAGELGDRFVIELTPFNWNPATQGSIIHVRMCLDAFILNDSYFNENGVGKTVSGTYWGIIKQSGKFYGKILGSVSETGRWQHMVQDMLIAADFNEIYQGVRPPGAGVTNTSSHPDLSQSGSNAEFFFAFEPKSPTSTTADTDSVIKTICDSFCVAITSIPVTRCCEKNEMHILTSGISIVWNNGGFACAPQNIKDWVDNVNDTLNGTIIATRLVGTTCLWRYDRTDGNWQTAVGVVQNPTTGLISVAMRFRHDAGGGGAGILIDFFVSANFPGPTAQCPSSYRAAAFATETDLEQCFNISTTNPTMEIQFP